MNVLRHFTHFFSEINHATLSGAIDVVAVPDEDGNLQATPFHVRFGKLSGVMRPRGKTVRITVNGQPVPLTMTLGAAGEAFFLEPCDESDVTAEDQVDDDLSSCSSPLSSPPGSGRAVALSDEFGVYMDALDLMDPSPLSATKPLASHHRQRVASGATTDSESIEARSPENVHWAWGDLPASRTTDLPTYDVPTYSPNHNPAGDDGLQPQWPTDERGAQSGTQQLPPKRPTFSRSHSGRSYFRKTLRLSPDALAQLPLNQGANTVTFTVQTSNQGEAQVSAEIYLWSSRSKIIVTNVDGTITRSNVLGQIIPVVGKDWSHRGVAQLLQSMKNNGYQILYISSRSIGQSTSTREYLETFTQDDARLPHGPVLLSPDRFFESVTRDLLYRRSQEFKISALADVRALFSAQHKPFYSGFAHSTSDVVSYQAAGISQGRIFLVDKESNVSHHGNHSTMTTSYHQLHELADTMFPAFSDRHTNACGKDDELYNGFNYWRTPLPEIDE